jgi:hypothetical protein
MRIRCTCLLALSLVLARAGLRAQDHAYTIKVKEPGKGETVLVERTEAFTNATKIVDGSDKMLMDRTDKGLATAVYKETILEQEGKKRPTKLRREYEKAQLKMGDKTIDLPYHGKTVLIEKQKDNRYHFQVENGNELAGPDAEALEKEFNAGGTGDDKFDLEKHLLPKAQVKLNDTWKIDMEALAKDFTTNTNMEVDLAKATGTGQLKKVYAKDGRPFGELHFLVEMPLKSVPGGPPGAPKLPLKAGSKASIDVTLNLCIDGSSVAGTLKGMMKMNMQGSVPLGNGANGNLTAATEFDNMVTKKEVKK